MNAERAKSLGLPEACDVDRVVFNSSANIVVASLFVNTAAGVRGRRIYSRRIEDRSYSAVEVEDENESHDDLFSCADEPSIVFRSTVWRTHGKGWGGESAGIWACDLRTNTRALVMAPNGLVVGGDNRDAFISSILEATTRSEFVLKIGVKEPRGADRYDVSYQIARIRVGEPPQILGVMPTSFL
jgi:hypothetical protein